jgi:hypothetical protein
MVDWRAMNPLPPPTTATSSQPAPTTMAATPATTTAQPTTTASAHSDTGLPSRRRRLNLQGAYTTHPGSNPAPPSATPPRQVPPWLAMLLSPDDDEAAAQPPQITAASPLPSAMANLTPAEQDQVRAARLACPRLLSDASNMAYARRLKQANLPLSLDMLAAASGSNRVNLLADPTINPRGLDANESQKLHAAKAACPRELLEADLTYARRLWNQDPTLSLEALAEGSGATVHTLRKDPTIRPPALDPNQQALLDQALAACPRNQLTAIKYARKLKQNFPGLTLPALAAGSGVQLSALKADPHVNPPLLPNDEQGKLNRALATCPREFETAIKYALKLKAFDPSLSIEALALGAGVKVEAISHDLRLNPPQLPQDQQRRVDDAVRRFPRAPTHKSDAEYARRLKEAVPDLSLEELSAASHVQVPRLKVDPKVNPPLLSDAQQALLDTATAACARGNKKDIAYARMLKKHTPALGIDALAKGSGAMVSSIKADPSLNPPRLAKDQQDKLDAAQARRPRKDNESDISYARELKALDGTLDLDALSKASGATLSYLTNDPRVNPPELSGEQQVRLDRALQAQPRTDPKEGDLTYGRRLWTQDPSLSFEALAKGSGAMVHTLRKDAKKWTAPETGN